MRVPQVVRRWPQLIPNRRLDAPTPGDSTMTESSLPPDQMMMVHFFVEHFLPSLLAAGQRHK